MISKPVRLTTSLLRWGKVSWLCCAGVGPNPTGSITLVSSLRENLRLHSSYLPLGVSQRTCDLHVSVPNDEDTRRLLEINRGRGFPGMLGSIDCIH